MAVKSFFQNGKLLKALNHTLLTLISKCTEARTLAEYRPISCCNLLYKFISMVLCNRLKQVVGCLISENQNAFLQGRNITDCILLAHEMWGISRRREQQKPALRLTWGKRLTQWTELCVSYNEMNGASWEVDSVDWRVYRCSYFFYCVEWMSIRICHKH